MSNYRWELPLASAETNSTGYIHGNTKPHLFNTETGWSHCNKYWQEPLFAEEIEFICRSKTKENLAKMHIILMPQYKQKSKDSYMKKF